MTSRAAPLNNVASHVVYILTAACLALAVPPETYRSATKLFLVVGLVGLWRYSWALINLLRALYYRAIDYPRLKRRAERMAATSGIEPHTYFLVTSFKIATPVTMRVYRALFEAARNSPHGATVVASVVDMADQRLIAALHSEMLGESSPVKLDIVRIPGTGKRDALACGLAAIRSYGPGADPGGPPARREP